MLNMHNTSCITKSQPPETARHTRHGSHTGHPQKQDTTQALVHVSSLDTCKAGHQTNFIMIMLFGKLNPSTSKATAYK